MQPIQTISTSAKTDLTAPTQAKPDHMKGTSFALTMGEDASETAEPAHSDTITQARDETAPQAEKSDLDSPHASDFPSEGEAPSVDQASEAKDTHKASTASDGELGQNVDFGTASGNSTEHTRSTSREERHAHTIQSQKATPASAMIQGLSQPNLVSDAAAVSNPNEAESKAHNKPAAVAGVIGTERQTKQSGEPKESMPTNSSDRFHQHKLLMSSNYSTERLNRDAGFASLMPEAQKRYPANRVDSAEVSDIPQGEMLKSHKNSRQTELLHLSKLGGPSDKTTSTEKVNFTAQAAASSQTSASSLVAITQPTQMLALQGIPERSTEPITATVRTLGQHAATSNTSRTGAHGSPLVPQGVTTHTQTAQTADKIAQTLSEQSTIGIEPTNNTDELPWETRPTNAPNTAKTVSPAPRAELPQHLSHTFAEALKRAPDRPIEIALNPAELGRVRMIMSTSETGITVSVAADRGETLDLMRRSIDDLAKSLNDLGFEDVSFAFDQGQQRAEQQEQTNSGDLATADEPLAEHQTTIPLARVSNVVTTGIDMRL